MLCLWLRPAAAAPIQPLALELPYAANVAVKKKKKKKKQTNKQKKKKKKNKQTNKKKKRWY